MAIDIVARALAVSGKQNLENYYTKTQSDARYVKQTTGHNKVYATDSTGTDSELGYSQSPANSAIMQYTSSGTVRTNTPTVDLDAVNKKYGDEHYVKSSENFVKAFTIPNGAGSGTLTADVKQKLCNPDGHNYYVFDDTSEMILKYSFNEDDKIIQYKAIYLQTDKAYEITMQILPSNGSWRRSQTILNGATANPTLTGTEAELTGLRVGGTDYKIPVNNKVFSVTIYEAGD